MQTMVIEKPVSENFPIPRGCQTSMDKDYSGNATLISGAHDVNMLPRIIRITDLSVHQSDSEIQDGRVPQLTCEEPILGGETLPEVYKETKVTEGEQQSAQMLQVFDEDKQESDPYSNEMEEATQKVDIQKLGDAKVDVEERMEYGNIKQTQHSLIHTYDVMQWDGNMDYSKDDVIYDMSVKMTNSKEQIVGGENQELPANEDVKSKGISAKEDGKSQAMSQNRNIVDDWRMNQFFRDFWNGVNQVKDSSSTDQILSHFQTSIDTEEAHNGILSKHEMEGKICEKEEAQQNVFGEKSNEDVKGTKILDGEVMENINEDATSNASSIAASSQKSNTRRMRKRREFTPSTMVTRRRKGVSNNQTHN